MSSGRNKSLFINFRQGLVPVLTGLIFLLISSNLYWGKESYISRIIKSDGKGYYAYLPALFIYHDFNFEFYDIIDDGAYLDPYNQFDYRVEYGDKKIIKYYVGTAIAIMPFFIVSHTISILTGEKADGYSKWYQLGVSFAAIFWFVIGLFYLDKVLYLFQIGMVNRMLVLVTASFGTHLFYYVLVEPSMSHVYSFAFVNAFLFFAITFFDKPTTNKSIVLSLLLGMIALIRPVNLLIILIIPFLAADVFKLLNGIKWFTAKPGRIILFFTLLLSVLFIQSVIYKISTDSFFIYAYRNEGFIFSDPHFFDFLFSYRKGFFLYTPIFLLSLLGLFYLGRESFYKVWTWLFFFLPTVYILSSWWIWYYGGSFSARVMVEFITPFMILLAVLFQKVHHRFKFVLFSGVFFIIVFCQIQTYQYRYFQIHWSDMNKEKYWDVFIRPDKIGDKP